MFKRSSRKWFYLLLVIVFFAFALRMVRLGGLLMWGDEGFSVFSANRDLLTITLDTTTIDPHPPLYYYLLHFYFSIAGYSELALRFFSVFFGTATVALVWATAKRMFGARTGLVAMCVVAIAPFAVHYSQEIRMYALAIFLSLLGLYLFTRLYEKETRALWVGYAVVMLLALFTLYHTALLFLALGLVLLALFVRRRAFVIRWFAVSFGVVAIFLPWLLLKYTSAFTGIKDVAGDATSMDLFTFLARGFTAISVGTTIPLAQAFQLAGLIAALIVLALILALITRTARVHDAFLMLLATIPILAYYPLYLLMPLYRGRLFALACIPLMILLARCALIIIDRARASFGKRGATIAAIPLAALIVGTFAYSLNTYFFTYNRYSAIVEDYIPAIRDIEQRAQAGDVVLFHAYWHEGYFLSYYHGPPLVYGALESGKDLDAAVAKVRNVWAIVQALPHHAAEDWLAQNAFGLGERDYGQMRVVAYRAGTPARGEKLDRPVEFDNGMQLFGYHINDAPVESGRGIVTVQLDWQASRKIGGDVAVSARLTNARGDVIWAKVDSPPAGGKPPVAEWPLGQVIVDRHVLTIPAGTPPGSYALEIVVNDSSENPVQVVAPDNLRGQPITLGTIAVAKATQSTSTLIPPVAKNARWNEIALVGLSSPEEVTTNGSLPLTLYWRALQKPTHDYLAEILVVDSTGAVRSSMRFRPANRYATREWNANETWLDKLVLDLPAATAPQAQVLIRLLDEQGTEIPPGAVELTRVRVNAR